MSRGSWNCLALLAVLVASDSPAQQQTGAPAGIPVPPAPEARPARGMAIDPGFLHYRVRVVDGRSGLPVRNAHVRLWYDEPAGVGYELATDAQGNGDMPEPAGEPVRVLVRPIDYNDCRKPLQGAPPQGYNLQGIGRTGVAAENGCGQVSVRTHPGELVLFVRSPRWYEGLNRGVTQ